jgi:hypothetical protein
VWLWYHPIGLLQWFHSIQTIRSTLKTDWERIISIKFNSETFYQNILRIFLVRVMFENNFNACSCKQLPFIILWYISHQLFDGRVFMHKNQNLPMFRVLGGAETFPWIDVAKVLRTKYSETCWKMFSDFHQTIWFWLYINFLHAPSQVFCKCPPVLKSIDFNALTSIHWP